MSENKFAKVHVFGRELFVLILAYAVILRHRTL